MKTAKHTAFAALLLVLATTAFAQQNKIWISGAARGVMYGDNYSTSAENDTTTPRKLQSGHAMVDLGVNIQPSENLLIQGMVRIRNDYGGFWGSGVTFDVRQLYIKGILGGFLKYQLGDINLKLSPYTFQNNVALVDRNAGVLTSVPLQQVQYDLFYTADNTWRQQGAAVDFALQFDKVANEAQFNFFTTRVIPTNFDTQDDRLYSGASVTVLQSKYLNLGAQYANLYDLAGTSNNTVYLKNPVVSGSAEVMYQLKKTNLSAALETGKSTLMWEGSETAPVLEDFFYDAQLKADWQKWGVSVQAGYRNVGPNFRSAGAQTMQINYTRPPLAYQRYGNAQNLRAISMVDLYRDASLYQTQIVAGLMAFDPRYDNATPYGQATPNRKGINVLATYEDVEKRWLVEASSDLLTDVVGQGTVELKNYNTNSLFAELRINKLLKWENRKLWLSARIGMQNTSRSGQQSFEEVDLQTRFNNINLTATLFGDLDLIAEYRSWKTSGFDLVAERNQYSQIIDYNEYTIDYNEDILGAGLQYNFSTKSHLRFMWQTFTWADNGGTTMPYGLNTWTLFFTMSF